MLDVLYTIFLSKIVTYFKKNKNKTPQDYSALFDCNTDEEKAKEVAEGIIKIWELTQALVQNNNGKFISTKQGKINTIGW